MGNTWEYTAGWLNHATGLYETGNTRPTNRDEAEQLVDALTAVDSNTPGTAYGPVVLVRRRVGSSDGYWWRVRTGVVARLLNR